MKTGNERIQLMKQNNTVTAGLITGAAAVICGLFLLVRNLQEGSGLVGRPVSPAVLTGAVLLAAAGGALLFHSVSLMKKAKEETSAARSRTDTYIPEVPPEGYLTAEIIGISRSLRLSGGEEGYHVVCRYTDPVSGKSATFSSEAVRKYPGKDIIGKPVRVYPVPEETEQFYVDLNTIGEQPSA